MELEASMQVTSTTNSPPLNSIGKKEPDQRRPVQWQTDKSMDLLEEFNGIENDGEHGLGISTPKRQSTTFQTSKVQESPGDEFGDDLDVDIDFDAVELAATQSIRQLEPPPESVRQSIAKLSQCSIY